MAVSAQGIGVWLPGVQSWLCYSWDKMLRVSWPQLSQLQNGGNKTSCMMSDMKMTRVTGILSGVFAFPVSMGPSTTPVLYSPYTSSSSSPSCICQSPQDFFPKKLGAKTKLSGVPPCPSSNPSQPPRAPATFAPSCSYTQVSISNTLGQGQNAWLQLPTLPGCSR